MFFVFIYLFVSGYLSAENNLNRVFESFPFYDEIYKGDFWNNNFDEITAKWKDQYKLKQERVFFDNVENVNQDNILINGDQSYAFIEPNDIPEILGFKPLKFEIFFDKTGKTNKVKINLWNKGDSPKLLNKSDNPFLRVEKILESCKTAGIEFNFRKDRLSSKFKQDSYSAFIGNGLFNFIIEKNEYINLEISPLQKSEIAIRNPNELIPDSRNRTKESLFENLEKNILTNPQGDLVIKNMPMINQGMKGYCVPATISRVMRYYGFDYDENQMAKLFSTDAGKGTDLNSLRKGIKALSFGLPIYPKEINFSISVIEKYLLRGIPVIWGIRYPSHVRLIVGINRTKNIIIYSDSWGENFEFSKMDFNKAKSLTSFAAVLK
ncbi:MAG: hypothetical protein ACD_79C00454G0001 [uncultured bacterium]|nr:MAG: hypothetical protein ACD_79C00454G0001 [uncultured bacterium]